MSGHAQNVLQQLRDADDHPQLDVDPERLNDATADALREHAHQLNTLRDNTPQAVDTPLADITHSLNVIADALDNGLDDPALLNEILHEDTFNTPTNAVHTFTTHEEEEEEEAATHE